MGTTSSDQVNPTRRVSPAPADTSPPTTVKPDTSAMATPDTSRTDRRATPCRWCEDPIPDELRADAKYCSKRCRQAAWRFRKPLQTRRVGLGGRQPRHVAEGLALRLAYADPPYPGLAGYYRDHPDYAGEVDHAELVDRLEREFPDGWALSTSAAALPDVLKLCPPEVRVGAWFRGERPTRSYSPLSAWEPVIYRGGRAYLSPLEERRLDALVHVARARTTDPRRVVGSKPAAFCYWLFGLLGALPGDELVDLYPGSGGVTRAWTVYTSPRTSDPSPRDQRDTSPRAQSDTSRTPEDATRRADPETTQPGQGATR